jgi:hypothetical protein
MRLSGFTILVAGAATALPILPMHQNSKSMSSGSSPLKFSVTDTVEGIEIISKNIGYSIGNIFGLGSIGGIIGQMVGPIITNSPYQGDTLAENPATPAAPLTPAAPKVPA